MVHSIGCRNSSQPGLRHPFVGDDLVRDDLVRDEVLDMFFGQLAQRLGLDFQASPFSWDDAVWNERPRPPRGRPSGSVRARPAHANVMRMICAAGASGTATDG